MPVGGDGGDGGPIRIGREQLLVRALQPDPAQVAQRRGAQVPAEGQLDRADRDERGAGDVGDADVVTRPFLDERDGALHGPGHSPGPVARGHRTRGGQARVLLPLVS
jgi:hypothetical protein